ncbi:hypothetical protein ApDm4_0795 [Acetobacter pomorum]|nr:hypothetical protein ApDm4_0795 [Acetobacter pomorum]
MLTGRIQSPAAGEKPQEGKPYPPSPAPSKKAAHVGRPFLQPYRIRQADQAARAA